MKKKEARNGQIKENILLQNPVFESLWSQQFTFKNIVFKMKINTRCHI